MPLIHDIKVQVVYRTNGRTKFMVIRQRNPVIFSRRDELAPFTNIYQFFLDFSNKFYYNCWC